MGIRVTKYSNLTPEERKKQYYARHREWSRQKTIAKRKEYLKELCKEVIIRFAYGEAVEDIINDLANDDRLIVCKQNKNYTHLANTDHKLQQLNMQERQEELCTFKQNCKYAHLAYNEHKLQQSITEKIQEEFKNGMLS